MATTSNFGWTTPDDTDLVRDGAAAIRTLGNAIDATVGGGYLYAGTRYYTSSGTFDKADPLGTGDIGLRAIRVRMVGGGGGGGGAAATAAGQVAIGQSASGGAYAESFIDNIASLSASETVTRGTGGSGGSAGANAGSAGGNSSFGALVIAEGGLAGSGGVAFTPYRQPSQGVPTASTGDLVVFGRSSVASNAVSATVILGGAGGGSVAGDGGAGVSTNAGFAGDNGASGNSFGGGGSGGVNAESRVTARSGGAGSNGIVIVDCYV